MTRQIVINNGISLIIHAVFCLLSYLLFYVAGRSMSSMLTFTMYVLSAITIPFFYFLCGRLLLGNTGNVTNNILSVTVLAAILLVFMFMSWYIPDLFMANLSFFPFSLFLGFLPSFIVTLVLALLPSTILYIGMITRK